MVSTVPRYDVEVDLTVDGEVLRIKTCFADQLRAERALGRSPMDAPMEQVAQVWFAAFKRRYPDHPAAKAFGRFSDALQAHEDVERDDEDEPDPLVPTQSAE